MYWLVFLCQTSCFSELLPCLSVYVSAKLYKVVLGLRNFGLFQVLILSILHIIRTCLFISVSFGVPVTVVPATRSNDHKENLLQPAGPGKISQSKRQFLKIKFPIALRYFEDFMQSYFFLSCN